MEPGPWNPITSYFYFRVGLRVPSKKRPKCELTQTPGHENVDVESVKTCRGGVVLYHYLTTHLDRVPSSGDQKSMEWGARRRHLRLHWLRTYVPDLRRRVLSDHDVDPYRSVPRCESRICVQWFDGPETGDRSKYSLEGGSPAGRETRTKIVWTPLFSLQKRKT